MRFCILLSCALLLTSCGSRDDGVINVVFIGDRKELLADGLRLSYAGQHVRAAVAEGLVALDGEGGVIPAIAERWIVTDDGASYIFRLRNSDWPNGKPITGEDVRDELQRNIRNLQGTSLGLDLAQITAIRAMTGRVVEIRLASPMPDFLQLLAQPELGLRHGGRGTGPMAIAYDPRQGPIELHAVPPESRGLPRREDWKDDARTLHLRAFAAQAATTAFARGEADVVLGGRLADLPFADTGALARGTVRLEAGLGLFGLEVVKAEGFLAQASNREVLAMAVDRAALVEPFNIGGWTPTTRIVAPDLPGDSGLVGERWADLRFDRRQAMARQRVLVWKGDARSDRLRLTIEQPPGPGSAALLRRLAKMYADVGIVLEPVAKGARPDLRLKDRTARYGAARWFFNQFNCQLTDDLCSPEADRLVAEADRAGDPTLRAELLAQAERLLMAENYYIPFGAPIRWSLVRAGNDGFSENAWAVHPLFALAQGTI